MGVWSLPSLQKVGGMEPTEPAKGGGMEPIEPAKRGYGQRLRAKCGLRVHWIHSNSAPGPTSNRNFGALHEAISFNLNLDPAPPNVVKVALMQSLRRGY